MSVLAKFFNAWVLLSLFLLTANMLVVVFSQPLTGKADLSSGFGVVDRVASTNVNALGSSRSTITPTALATQTPSLGFAAFWSAYYIFMDMLPFNKLLTTIFGDIYPTTYCVGLDFVNCADIAEKFGIVLQLLIWVIWIAGLAYLVLAVIGAFTGSGQP